EAQHNLENLARLETGQCALLRGQGRLETKSAGLEYRMRQCDDGGAGPERRQQHAIAAATFHTDVSALPRHRLRDRAQSHFSALGIESIAQPLGNGVVA